MRPYAFAALKVSAMVAPRPPIGLSGPSVGYCQVGESWGLWHGLGHEHDVQSVLRLPLIRLKSSTKVSGCITGTVKLRLKRIAAARMATKSVYANLRGQLL